MSEDYVVDEKWCEYATEVQKKYILSYLKPGNGSCRKVGKEFGVCHQTVSRAIEGARKRAIKAGYSPSADSRGEAPDGYHVTGKSMLRKDGNTVMEWIKTKKDKDDFFQAMMDAMSSLTEEIRGKSLIIDEPEGTVANLLTVYPVADPHIGLYAWALEAGEDYDLEIAKSLLIGSMNRLVSSAPKTDTCLIANLGDFFHSDSDSNTTARSGNKLDVDTRWPLVMRVGVQIFIEFVNIVLKKHKKVRIIIDIGNHDDHTAAMLSIALDCYFDNNPRVEVDPSPAKFHYYKFGKVLIGTTHGDTVKIEKLNQVMATDMPKEWGETVHRYFLTGHIHHKSAYELLGCIVESFNTVAAKDFWHAGKGYRSKRNMVYKVYDREHGEVEMHTVDIGQIDLKTVEAIKNGSIAAQKSLEYQPEH